MATCGDALDTLDTLDTLECLNHDALDTLVEDLRIRTVQEFIVTYSSCPELNTWNVSSEM